MCEFASGCVNVATEFSVENCVRFQLGLWKPDLQKVTFKPQSSWHAYLRSLVEARVVRHCEEIQGGHVADQFLIFAGEKLLACNPENRF